MTVALFNSDGSTYAVTNLTGSERFRFEIPVPHCTATFNACTSEGTVCARHSALRWRNH